MARIMIAFALAVIGAALVATVIQTQFNLAALVALSVPIDLTVRMHAISHDLLHFGPIIALIFIPTFAIAFVVAYWLSRKLKVAERWWFILAGGVGLAVAFTLIDSLAPMPILIAANRTLLGFILMSSCGAFGGWIFDRLWHPRPQELLEELP
ncbi:hypothetical protein AB8S08_12540 [Pseudidiomarina sp. PP-1MA]|uniref:Uncharacterized protein n=1 Tax=Pseudidiomarina sp. PP-1MA TaxID=3237706 RepID=A0AB39X7X6_9GAMM